MAGDATLNLTSGSGSYAGVSVFSDPKLANPAGSNVITLNNSGTVNGFAGTIDVPSGSVVDTGSSAFHIGGQLIAANVTDGGSGAVTLTGSFTVAPSCPVTDDSVKGVSGTTSNTGRAIVESDCNGHNGIVDFNYLP